MGHGGFGPGGVVLAVLLAAVGCIDGCQCYSLADWRAVLRGALWFSAFSVVIFSEVSANRDFAGGAMQALGIVICLFSAVSEAQLP